MTPLKDDKETKEEPTVQILSDDDSAEVEEAKDGGEEVTGDVDEDDEVQVLQSVGGPSVPSAKDEDEEDEEEKEEDDADDDEEDDEEEEDLGTEYLVRPVGEVEDEDDTNDFEPEVDGVEEDIDEEIEEEDADEDIKDINLSAGKSGKRKRVAKDHNEPADVTGADDIRPSKH